MLYNKTHLYGLNQQSFKVKIAGYHFFIVYNNFPGFPKCSHLHISRLNLDLYSF